ncbi:MAG: hypothetical protein OEL50_04670 [Rhodospirillaceae bacterium]|nr:hypothetical protein [Rhodospirillaceae bacterium]
MKKLPDWLISYLRQPFVFIVWVMETYAINTARLRIFMSKPTVAKVFKLAITLTVVTWIFVGLMANEEDRSRLTDTLKGFWGEVQDINEQKKLQN